MSTFIEDMNRRQEIVIQLEAIEQEMRTEKQEHVLAGLWQKRCDLKEEKKNIDDKHDPRKRR